MAMKIKIIYETERSEFIECTYFHLTNQISFRVWNRTFLKESHVLFSVGRVLLIIISTHASNGALSIINASHCLPARENTWEYSLLFLLVASSNYASSKYLLKDKTEKCFPFHLGLIQWKLDLVFAPVYERILPDKLYTRAIHFKLYSNCNR